jgi:hypothetical protein
MVNELLASRRLKAIVCHAPALAWEHVTQNAAPGELICITGSFYLAAEMRPLVLAKNRAAVSLV